MTIVTGFFMVTATLGYLVPTVTWAATTKTATTATCTFTRDLQLGVTGDDVLCLQKYLNTHGFSIAETGVGSAGHETGEYKTLTEAAVIKWQKAKKLTPAIGYFGAQSRLLFKKGGIGITTSADALVIAAPLISVPETPGAIDPDAALRAQVEALKAVLEGRTPTLPTPVTTHATVAATVVIPVATTPAVTSSTTETTDASVRKMFGTVLTLVSKAESALKKNSKASSNSDAKVTLALAKDHIITALRAYLTGDYATVESTLSKAKKVAGTAYTTANAAGQKQRAEKSLSDIQSKYDDARDAITEAEDGGKTVTSAKRYLKKAASAIDDVETAMDDEDYTEALDALDTADGFITEAVDAL